MCTIVILISLFCFTGTDLGAKYVSFDELLATSDFVIIACPLNEETANLMDAAAFKKMKPTAVLVNVARGGIVDQPALVAALQEGTIFAAGLDVMTPEPLATDDLLLTLPNCGKWSKWTNILSGEFDLKTDRFVFAQFWCPTWARLRCRPETQWPFWPLKTC